MSFLALWDALVWITVLFPLLTGGVWIHRPDLKIELSQLTVPVLGLTALFFLLPLKQQGERIQLFKQTSCFKFFRLAFNLWSKALQNKPRLTIWLAGFAWGTVWAFCSLRRHWAFESNAVDLGIFTNAIYNLTFFNSYVSSVKDGINLFMDHQSPIFWLMVPLFKVFPKPETLLIVQAYSLCSAGVAVYYLAKFYCQEEKKPWLVNCSPILFWLYLPLRNANAFDFHPETAMVPLFLFSILCFETAKSRSKTLMGFGLWILALATKESAGIVSIGVGLSWLFQKRFHRGLLFSIGGLLVFLFDTQVVPTFFGTSYVYNHQYAHFGSRGLIDVLTSPFHSPFILLQHLFGPARLQFLLWTLGPLAFLPLFAPRFLVAALPGYAILFLSEGDHRVQIIYHYAVEPAVGVFWALCAAARVPSQRRTLVYNPVWILFCALVFLNRSDFYPIRFHSPTEHQVWIQNEVIPRVSPSVSISSSSALTPHVSTRPWANHLPKILRGSETVDCIFFDLSLNNFPMGQPEIDLLLSETLRKQRYLLAYECEGFQVYQKPQASCFTSMPRCPTNLPLPTNTSAATQPEKQTQ